MEGLRNSSLFPKLFDFCKTKLNRKSKTKAMSIVLRDPKTGDVLWRHSMNNRGMPDSKVAYGSICYSPLHAIMESLQLNEQISTVDDSTVMPSSAWLWTLPKYAMHQILVILSLIWLSWLIERHGGPNKARVGYGSSNYWWYSNVKRSNFRLGL